MKMQVSLVAASIAVLGVATGANAQDTRIYDGTGGVLNDAGFDNNFNTIPGVTRFEIFVPDTGEIRGIKAINLDINHTWVGDLTIDLVHKDSGTSVRLIDRPGVPETTFGNSDDLDGEYSFIDGFAPIPEESDPGGSGMVAPGNYGPSVGNLFDFQGLEKFGVWSLVIQDDASGDTGVLNSWQIIMNNAPAPGALALLGLAGLCGTRRRR